MSRYFSYIPAFIYTMVLYLLGFWYAELITGTPGSVTPVWPAAGVAFAAVLLFGFRIWPALALAIMLCHLVFDDLTYTFILFSMCAGVGSVLLVYWIIRRFGPRDVFRIRVRNVFVLLAGGIVANLISAIIGVSGMLYTDMILSDQFLSSFFVWWSGNTLGVIVCSPAIVVGSQSFLQRRAGKAIVDFAPLYEKVLWLVTLIASVVLLIGASANTPAYLSITFFPSLAMIWSSLRFSPLYTFLAAPFVVLVYVHFVTTGADIGQGQTVADLVGMVLFLATMSFVPQLVAASTYERQTFARKLAQRANYDHLTGLPNRNAFEEQVVQVLREAGRTQEETALCYMDLDQFKVVNDTCGHRVGDHLIKQVASLLTSRVREGDLLARLGGDEFGLLLRHCDVESATEISNRLRSKVESYRFVWQRRIFAFTVSIGVTPVQPGQDDFARLLSEADTACYTAKEMGRNRVKVKTVDDEHLSYSHSQMEWVVRINDALRNNHFRLYCQPISSIQEAEQSVGHFEVLLRMVDEEGNLLLPGVFIPAAERFDMMSKVDRWVVSNTLEWLSAHPSYLGQIGMCSINLSGASLSDPTFLTFLTDIISQTKAPPHKICFEITETAAIADLSHAAQMINTMKKLGCKFALDDFGSGLASFSYLRTLQVDYLKIDGSFVRDIVDRPVDLAMVRSINEVGHVMGKKTIAEYVESEEIGHFLKDLGVDYAQGVAVGAPVPIDDFFSNQSYNSKPESESA